MKHIVKFIITIYLLIFSMNSMSSEWLDNDATIGGIEFERSCAICHGFNAKGKGVMSDSLTKKPSDLTQLTKNNNGYFPFNHAYTVIDGTNSV